MKYLHDAPVSATQSDALRFDFHRVRQHFFVELDHEIFSTVMLYVLTLIREGQRSFSGESMSVCPEVLANRKGD